MIEVRGKGRTGQACVLSYFVFDRADEHEDAKQHAARRAKYRPEGMTQRLAYGSNH